MGLTTPELLAAVRSFHLRYIAWSLRTLDGAGASAAAVLSRVQSKLSDGDIVLLHDAPPVGGGEREPIAVQVLPRILECLDERGLRSVTVAELLDEEPYLSGERGQLAAAPISLSDVRFPRIPFVVLSTLVVLLLASVSLARASEPGLPTGLLEAATRLQEHETLVARFVQTKESLLFEEPVRQTGRMELRRSDGRLRWSYDAGPSILLAEGRIYVSGKDGRIRGPGQRIPGGGRMVQVLRGLFTLDPGVLGTSFAVDDLGSGRYSLQSKEKGAAFPQVLLSLSGSPELLRDIELSEASGDRLHLHFDALEPNAAIPADRLALPSERRGEGEPRASSEGERQP